MKKFRSIAMIALLVCLVASFGFASEIAVESSRVHSASGSFGCAVSGATVASPSVITCTAAHNLVTGDQVQITGIGGTTTDNTLAYALVLSSTTFSIWSDPATSASPIAGVGVYTSGGAVSMAYDVSSIAGKWSLRARLESLTAGKNVLVALQGSTDGFVNDIKTYAAWNVSGSSPVGCVGIACGPALEFTINNYQLPSAYVGVANGRLRFFVQSIDASGSAKVSWFFEQ